MAGTKKIFIKCSICNEQLLLTFDEAFQEKFKKKARYFPYPILVRHKDHHLIVYLDAHLDDRGVVATELEIDGENL